MTLDIEPIINGAISANWVLVVLASISLFFVLRYMNKQDKLLEKIMEEIKEVKDQTITNTAHIGALQEKDREGRELSRELNTNIALLVSKIQLFTGEPHVKYPKQ